MQLLFCENFMVNTINVEVLKLIRLTCNNRNLFFLMQISTCSGRGPLYSGGCSYSSIAPLSCLSKSLNSLFRKLAITEVGEHIRAENLTGNRSLHSNI